MAYEIEKSTGDLVISGVEQGIQPSPHKGTANIQNANITTETGEIMNSFLRVQETMISSATGTGTLSFIDSSHVALSIAGSNNLFKGNWVTVSGSSNTSQLPNGTYYVNPSSGSGFQLSSSYNTLPVSFPVTANYLIVGSGAGGITGAFPQDGGGGGGAGQVKASTHSITTTGTFPVVVGTGGASDTSGNSSSVFSVTSVGGSAGSGSTGGTSGSGKTGGVSSGSAGTGGGGDSANGTSGGGSTNGFAGGAGTASSITGSPVTYAGGGGGGTGNTGSGTGGAGGAGGGGAGGSVGVGVAGATNTGGGGGGGGGNTNSGGAGGSGIVVIAFPTGSLIGVTGGTVSYTDTMEVHTFTASGNLVVPVQTSNPLSGFTTGLTATIQLLAVMGKPLASATETYFSGNNIYNRYYVLDSQNLVWVYDTQNETTYALTDNVNWFLPDYQTNYCTDASGIGVISGFLIVAAATGLYGKPTSLLGQTNAQTTTWVQFPDVTGWQGTAQSQGVTHFCYTSKTGRMYITDGSFIMQLFPGGAPSLGSSDNIQSFASYTATGTTGFVSLISGTTLATSDALRVPIVLFTENGGQLPTAITAGTVYYAQPNTIPSTYLTFQVYTAASGGSALDLELGAYGTQYYNTFYPIATAPAWTGTTPSYLFSNQRVALPIYEISQCMTEIGSTVIIGCQSNALYPWGQINNLADGYIALPEQNTVNIVTVHQMAYIFTGNKGNIYITDGSTASLVSTVPDYCAGIAGTPASYVEPVFTWGGAAYIRGKVYFSILDQTATKVGNCGGIWAFIPSQNFSLYQDVGIALHLENQSSYGTYNGVATVLLPKVNQDVVGPQYFSGWYSSVSSPSYGIDASGTSASPTFIVETDAIPTGTLLTKKTFEQIEVKLTTPLLTGDAVAMNYRKNLTDSWKSCGTMKIENNKRVSGYFSANFENTQWLQLQMIGTSGAGTSFVRESEIRVR